MGSLNIFILLPLLALSLVYCNAAENNGDNVQLKCPSTPIYPIPVQAHPLECSKYYMCLSDKPSTFTCCGSDLFDERDGKCKDKRLVDCGNRLDRDELEIICPETPEFPVLLKPHPVDCSKYYVCLSKRPTFFRCCDNELFDAKERKCKNRREVTCRNIFDRDDFISTTTIAPITTTTTTAPTTTTTTAPTTASPSGNVNKPNNPPPTDCKENDVDCILDKTKDVKGWFDCPEQYGHFPHGGSVQLFIHCDNWHPFIKRCGELTKFSPKYLVCVWDDIETPKTTPTTHSPTTTTTTTNTPVPTTTTTTNTPVPTTTTITPVPTTTNTPTTLPTTKKPNTPPPTDCKEDDVDCILDKTKDVNKWFDCPGKFGEFPHGSSKHLFIHCDNWYPYIKRCEGVTVFSPVHLVCVWDKTTPINPIIETTPAPIINNKPPPTNCRKDDADCIMEKTKDVKRWFRCPQSDGLFPHEAHEYLYISCIKWKPTIYKCADDSKFFPDLQACVWVGTGKIIDV